MRIVSVPCGALHVESVAITITGNEVAVILDVNDIVDIYQLLSNAAPRTDSQAVLALNLKGRLRLILQTVANSGGK